MLNRAVFNLPPLAKNDLAPLPAGAIRPEGWLKAQLRTAADGLTGRLYTFWDDVGNSAWRGGTGDAWERGPYYLDGLVPLAWLLDDADLKAVCMEFIEWTLSSQREDGFFGPEDNDDWWPRMVMLKALIQYFSATVDKRVPEFMYNYFRYEYQHIDEKPLRSWAAARGAENMLSVIWLYNLTGGKYPFLLKLLDRLRDQTLDWTAHYSAFPYTQSMAKIIPWEEMKAGLARERESGHCLTGHDRPYYDTQYHLSHVVNAAMGLKAPGVIGQFKSGTKECEAFFSGFSRLMKHHGVAYGMFTGDEHLSGNSPAQGTELCAVVEMMFTLETLIGCVDKPQALGDMLEKLAFNALPGTLSPDMMAHQYDQQANQVRASRADRPWYNNGSDANVFGLEPNFGCCTANMHQGWPKYAEHLWYATKDGGLAAVSYAPCEVRFFAGDTRVRLRVETEYPFDETVRILVEPAAEAEFPILLRIPAWADAARLTVCQMEWEKPLAGTYLTVRRVWKAGDEIVLTLPMKPRMTRWSRQSGAVELGPLLMALHPAETWTKISDHPAAPDYQVTTNDLCSFALTERAAADVERLPRQEPFGRGRGPYVTVDAVPAPEWKTDGDNCAPTPIGMKYDPEDVVKLRLEPYGDTCLRISQFPVATEKE